MSGEMMNTEQEGGPHESVATATAAEAEGGRDCRRGANQRANRESFHSEPAGCTSTPNKNNHYGVLKAPSVNIPRVAVKNYNRGDTMWDVPPILPEAGKAKGNEKASE